MSAPKHDHALRKASQKYMDKSRSSMQGRGGTSTPKFYHQSGKASTVPKSKKS